MPDDSKPSKKPPKEWWNKHYAEVKKDNPDYSDEKIRETVGTIWYKEMSTSQKKERREKEGKKYGKAEKALMVFMPNLAKAKGVVKKVGKAFFTKEGSIDILRTVLKGK